MENKEDDLQHKKIIGTAIGILTLIYLAWIGMWTLYQSLESNTTFLLTESSRFFYWLGMKIVLWLLPALYIAKIAKIKLVSLKQFEKALRWGIGSGVILGFVAVAPKLLSQQPILSPALSWLFFNAVLASPILEEILFRGAILPVFKQKYSFIMAHLITSILFLGLHIPGWYFQGVLIGNLKNPMGGALSIFLLSLAFGYVAHKSKTSFGSIIAHVLNNFFNT